eukprot:1184805-Prorocentrum_minimum.AAC.4
MIRALFLYNTPNLLADLGKKRRWSLGGGRFETHLHLLAVVALHHQQVLPGVVEAAHVVKVRAQVPVGGGPALGVVGHVPAHLPRGRRVGHQQTPLAVARRVREPHEQPLRRLTNRLAVVALGLRVGGGASGGGGGRDGGERLERLEKIERALAGRPAVSGGRRRAAIEQAHLGGGAAHKQLRVHLHVRGRSNQTRGEGIYLRSGPIGRGERVCTYRAGQSDEDRGRTRLFGGDPVVEGRAHGVGEAEVTAVRLDERRGGVDAHLGERAQLHLRPVQERGALRHVHLGCYHDGGRCYVSGCWESSGRGALRNVVTPGVLPRRASANGR